MPTRTLPAILSFAILLFANMILVTGPAWTQSRTPAFMVNQKLRLSQVGEKGRIYIRYDVRTVGGQGMKLYVYHHRDDQEGEPRKEYYFKSPQGEERISLNDQEIAVYTMWGQAVDAEGNPVAEPSQTVYVEYGGWRAWEEFQAADLRAPPPPLSGVAPDGSRPDADAPQLQLSPSTIVVNPGDQVAFQITTRNLPADEAVEWEVEGGGDWDVEDRRLVLRAPDDLRAGSKVVRVRAFVSRFPYIEASATVLVTTMKKSELR